MINRLNNLPERIQFLLILLIAPVIFSIAWVHDNVIFPEPDCGAVCEPYCPSGLIESISPNHQSLVCLTEEEYDRQTEREVNEILREVIEQSPPTVPAQTAN